MASVADYNLLLVAGRQGIPAVVSIEEGRDMVEYRWRHKARPAGESVAHRSQYSGPRSSPAPRMWKVPASTTV